LRKRRVAFTRTHTACVTAAVPLRGRRRHRIDGPE
jgi:hypothetical protein